MKILLCSFLVILALCIEFSEQRCLDCKRTKGVGELCGGDRNIYGKCEEGLKCQAFGSTPSQISLREKIRNKPGVCISKNKNS